MEYTSCQSKTKGLSFTTVPIFVILTSSVVVGCAESTAPTGEGPSPAPASPAPETISAGALHSCGLTTNGAAYCWGANSSGQLGDGTNTDRNVPVPVAGGLTYRSLNVSGHSCGLKTDGTVYCWGANSIGQLGDGTNTDRNVPVPVAGGLTFQSVSAGIGHTCGVTTDGTAYCWGQNDRGQLGDGTTTANSAPVPVVGGQTFLSLSAGWAYSCGVTTDGTAYCWGENNRGQLGDGTTTASTVQVRVLGGFTFQSISAASNHTCGVTTDAAAYCWGWNGLGELGDGTGTGSGDNYSSVPVPVAGAFSFQSVGTGFQHSCGLTTDGAAYCWGANANGELGNDTTGGIRNAPGPVKGGLTFRSVNVAGGHHSCGETLAGKRYCWGANGSGTLGDGTTTSSSVPVGVAKFP